MTYSIVKEYPSSLNHPPEKVTKEVVATNMPSYEAADRLRLHLMAEQPKADFFVIKDDISS